MQSISLAHKAQSESDSCLPAMQNGMTLRVTSDLMLPGMLQSSLSLTSSSLALVLRVLQAAAAQRVSAKVGFRFQCAC